MANPLIRDFIYLDIERIRSYVAQAAGGLTSEKTQQAQHNVGGSGQAQGGIPIIAHASGSADYHYSRSHSETKSLHDHIFEEFYRTLKPGEHISDFTKARVQDWLEPSFKDGAFIVTRGRLKIIDYQSVIVSIQNLPTLLETTMKLAAFAPGVSLEQTAPNPSAPKGNTTQSQQAKELQQLKTQLKSLPLKEFTQFVTQTYGDLVRMKIFPFPSDPGKLFVGTADRQLFRYLPSALINLYGSVIDASWIYVLQVNKGTYYDPGILASKTGNEIEDSLEQLADILSGLARITQGVQFPVVAVTPIAIYREV